MWVYLIPSLRAGTIKVRGTEASGGYHQFGVQTHCSTKRAGASVLACTTWANLFVSDQSNYKNQNKPDVCFLQVDVRLNSLGDAARGNKTFLDEHTSAMEGVTKDAKRKWEMFAEQAENDCKVGSTMEKIPCCS